MESDFYRIRKELNINRALCVEIFEVTDRTIRNWDRKGAPKHVLKWLMFYSGKFDFLGKDWEGFYFDDGMIISPEGITIKPSDVRANHFYRQIEDKYKHGGYLAFRFTNYRRKLIVVNLLDYGVRLLGMKNL